MILVPLCSSCPLLAEARCKVFLQNIHFFSILMPASAPFVRGYLSFFLVTVFCLREGNFVRLFALIERQQEMKRCIVGRQLSTYIHTSTTRPRLVYRHDVSHIILTTSCSLLIREVSIGSLYLFTLFAIYTSILIEAIDGLCSSSLHSPITWYDRPTETWVEVLYMVSS